MLLVNDSGTQILRKLVDGEFQWGDKVNLKGVYDDPGVVVEIDEANDSINVLWKSSVYDAFKSWFEPWELMHVV